MLEMKDAAKCPKCSFPLYVVGYEVPLSRKHYDTGRSGHCQRCNLGFLLEPEAPMTTFAEHEVLKKQFYGDREGGDTFKILCLIVGCLMLPILLQLLGFWEWFDNVEF